MTEQTQPTDAELEACPFCGNANAIVYDDLLTFHAGCLSCGSTGSVSSYRNGAIAAWNRRAVLAKWGTPAGAGEPQPSSEGPPEVWLQLHCDCLPHERTEPVDYTGGDVTWCWHAIHSDDVRYVRADLATTQQPTQAHIEKCAVCGDGNARLLVMRNCDVCGSDYAGQSESELNLALERARRATQAQAGAVPMSEKFLQMMTPAKAEPSDFAAGVRFAEAHHGIEGADHA